MSGKGDAAAQPIGQAVPKRVNQSPNPEARRRNRPAFDAAPFVLEQPDHLVGPSASRVGGKRQQEGTVHAIRERAVAAPDRGHRPALEVRICLRRDSATSCSSRSASARATRRPKAVSAK